MKASQQGETYLVKVKFDYSVSCSQCIWCVSQQSFIIEFWWENKSIARAYFVCGILETPLTNSSRIPHTKCWALYLGNYAYLLVLPCPTHSFSSIVKQKLGLLLPHISIVISTNTASARHSTYTILSEICHHPYSQDV